MRESDCANVSFATITALPPVEMLNEACLIVSPRSTKDWNVEDGRKPAGSEKICRCSPALNASVNTMLHRITTNPSCVFA